MKKVLCLVLASNSEPFKSIREQGQEVTWDSIEVEGVETIYYFSHILPYTLKYDKYLSLPCSNDYLMMHWRLKLALDYVDRLEWDYIFRMSASSYVNKKRLLEKAQTLSENECYCGIQCCGGSVASGCGFFMSRDVANILREQIPFNMHKSRYGIHPDDVLVGQILEANKILVTKGAQRLDYYYSEGEPKNHYHIRCKKDNVENDGYWDIKAMKELFENGF